MSKRRQKINTIIFLAVLIVGFGAGFAWTWFSQEKTPGTAALIQVDGETTTRLELSKDTQITVGDPDGDYNRVVVKDGAVSVTEANCPDKVCVDTGAVSGAGEVIACLPHKLIITVEAQ